MVPTLKKSVPFIQKEESAEIALASCISALWPFDADFFKTADKYY